MIHEQVLALTTYTERMTLWALLGVVLLSCWCAATTRSTRTGAGRPDHTYHHLGAWVDIRGNHTTTMVVGGLWGTSVVVVDRRSETPSTTGGGRALGSVSTRRRPPPVPACVGSGRPRTPSPEIPDEHESSREARPDRHQADGRPAHRQLHRRDPARSCAHR